MNTLPTQKARILTTEFALGDQPAASTFLGRDSLSRKVVSTGTHRVLPLDETMRRAQSMAKAAGVARVAEITRLDRLGIPVFNSIRPGAAPGNLTVTSGKGLTRTAAQASALMEAIERHYGEPLGRSGVWASSSEMQAVGYAVDPRRLLLDRGVSFDRTTRLEWWPSRELNSGETVFVPARSVFVPYEGEPWLFASSSNGLASGNTLPEATLHAVLELIERDATAFGELCDSGAAIDPETLPEEAIDLLRRFESQGIEVSIRLLDSELDLPTVHVVIHDPDSADPMLVNGGFGCHLDPAVALCRALTEAAQSRLSVISGAREDLAGHAHLRQAGYEAAKERFESWSRARRTIDFRSIPNRSSETIETDLAMCLESLTSKGFITAMAVALTPSTAPLSVVRVIVPGLEIAHVQRKRVGPRLAAALGKAG